MMCRIRSSATAASRLFTSKGRLYILHVVPKNYPFSMNQRERLTLLTTLRERAEREGVPVRTAEQQGDPARTILLHANARKADLVVLGSNSRRGWKRVREGSVGERVLRRASWPLLIVPRDVLSKKRTRSASATPRTAAHRTGRAPTTS